ncbi:ATP-binding protein [Kamptonema animale CS-326]|uniref:sensor histidine kinase n=1 Tax=Kamptonema animale TaxID=92934 RepID=UPI0023305F65|nr:ATP-binding protein [Kamptonema animale]MDB9511139.1 ATP-binding protein [Kamptonema animale CS-326]
MIQFLSVAVSGNSGTPSWEWLQIAIAIAYYAIPTMLVYSLYKGRDIPFQWMFLIFGAFFAACGTAYIIDLWYLWFPNSWVSEFMKAMTAFVCGSTVLLLLTLMPFALALPSPAKLEAANLALENEIEQRRRAESALEELAQVLELRVKERTASLLQANATLTEEIRDRTNAEQALRQSEAQLIAEHQHLQQTLQKLKQTQAQLVHSEKMSSLGQLTAGIAHEINNPVNFIKGNITYANNYFRDLLRLLDAYAQNYPNPVAEVQAVVEEIDLGFLLEDLPKLLSSMEVGSERIRQIVHSMRNFSRFDRADMKLVDLHEGIESTLLILQQRLKPSGKNPGIKLIKEYGTLPLVECCAGQLNQVFMNVISNGIDALEELMGTQSQMQKGKDSSSYEVPAIRIRTEVVEGDRVAVHIGDNGLGIPTDIRRKLFDPFFTTKQVGKGTGLGLSISYQIVVEKHSGQLECISPPGQGTEFVISIPMRQKLSSQVKAIDSQVAVNI